MKQVERENVIRNSAQIVAILKDTLDYKTQKIENVTYFDELEFEGSGLEEREIYVVKIQNSVAAIKASDLNDEKQHNKTGLFSDGQDNNKYATYEIYDKNGQLIATVEKDGKVKFEPEYLKKLKDINEKLYDKLNLDNLDFKLPEELKENDILLTEDDLEKVISQDLGNKRTSNNDKNGQDEKSLEDKKDENKSDKDKQIEDLDTENSEQRKAKVAKTLGVKQEEIKGISQINPVEKITDDYNMRDLIPESKDYERIEIACVDGRENRQGDARFTILGVKKDGTREPLNSISSIEGVSTNKRVISINEDGSKVEEKSVQGLLRINARNREDRNFTFFR